MSMARTPIMIAAIVAAIRPNKIPIPKPPTMILARVWEPIRHFIVWLTRRLAAELCAVCAAVVQVTVIVTLTDRRASTVAGRILAAMLDPA